MKPSFGQGNFLPDNYESNAIRHIKAMGNRGSTLDSIFKAMEYDDFLKKQFHTQMYGGDSPRKARNKAVDEALNILYAIKAAHINELNKKVLGAVQEFLSEEELNFIAKQQSKCTKYQNINLANELNNNLILREAGKNKHGGIFSDYARIVKEVEDIITSSENKQSLNNIKNYKNYPSGYEGSAEHVKDTFNITKNNIKQNPYFDYPNGQVENPICNASTMRIIDEMYNNIKDSIPEESDNSSQETEQIKSAINDILEEDDSISSSDINTIMEKVSNNSSSDEEIKEELQVIKNLLEEYKNSNEADKAELKKDIEWLKSSYENLSEQFKNLNVTFDYGSNQALKDYYEGFTTTLYNAFSSAQAVEAAQLKLDGTKSVSTKIGVQLAKLIPCIGGNISDGIQSSADYKVAVEVQKMCRNLIKFGKSQSKFEKYAKYMANFVAVDEKSAEYIEKYELPNNSGIIAKFKKFAKDTKDSVDNKVVNIEVSEPSPQEFLGDEHAKKLLEQYIYSGKYRQLDQDNLIDNIMELFLADLAKETVEDSQQDPDQIPFGSSLVDKKDDGELTPKSKQIKEMQEQMAMMQAMFQAQLEEANKLNAEKDQEIKELKKNSLQNPNEPSNEELINIIKSASQQNAEKDDIIQKQADENIELRNINQNQSRVITDQRVQIQERDDTIESQKNTIIERDNTIIEKDQIIADRDSTIEKQGRNVSNLERDKEYLYKLIDSNEKLTNNLEKEIIQKDVKIKDLTDSLEVFKQFEVPKDLNLNKGTVEMTGENVVFELSLNNEIE